MVCNKNVKLVIFIRIYVILTILISDLLYLSMVLYMFFIKIVTDNFDCQRTDLNSSPVPTDGVLSELISSTNPSYPKYVLTSSSEYFCGAP